METIATLTVISLMAVLAPLITELTFLPRLPVVVVEIGLGIVVGPQVLGWGRPTEIINFISELGLAFLLFQAGFELKLDRIKGRPLRLAVISWIISVGLALTLGGLLEATGVVSSFVYVGLAMSTTALGVILPILDDSGILQTSYGNVILAIGAIGEFGPIVLSAILLEKSGNKTVNALLLNAFLLIILAGFFLVRYWQPGFVIRIVDQTINSTAQLGIRISLLTLVGLIFLSNTFGFSSLLGAFGAGLIVAQAIRHLNESDRELLTGKYQALGFGFLIPIFFIVSGMKFNLVSLFQSGWNLLLVPFFLLLFVAVRLGPVFFLAGPQFSSITKLKIGLFSSVELPLVVAITNLGVMAGQLSSETATAMMGAAMLSVLILPKLALKLNLHLALDPVSNRASV